MSESEPNADLEAQNKAAQEAARKQIEADEAQRLEAQRAAVGDTSTKPMDFATAAAETEKLEQPPNPFNAKELEQPLSVTQPPAKNVNPETLPESVQTEAREGEVISPSQASTSESAPSSTTSSNP